MKVLCTVAILLAATWALVLAQQNSGPTTDRERGEIVTGRMRVNQTRKIKPKKGRSNVQSNRRGGGLSVCLDDNVEGDTCITIGIFKLEQSKKKGSGKDREALKGGDFPSFEDQNFNDTEPVENDKYPGTQLSCTSFSMSLEMKKVTKGQEKTMGSVKLSIYVFDDNGTLTVGQETSSVYPGSVKLNLILENFDFCNGTADVDCGGETASGVDVSFFVRAKKGKSAEEGKQRPGEKLDVIRLGDSAALRMSRMVKIDDVWKELDEPCKMIGRGANNIVRCRFKKFSQSFLYDPVLDEDLPGLDDDDSEGSGLVYKANIVLLMGLAVIAKLFM